MQSTDKAKSDKHFIELKDVIKALLKELIFNLWNIKSSILDKLFWPWFLSDHLTDLRDFLGGLYYIFKLIKGIHKENLKIENAFTESLPSILDG